MPQKKEPSTSHNQLCRLPEVRKYNDHPMTLFSFSSLSPPRDPWAATAKFFYQVQARSTQCISHTPCSRHFVHRQRYYLYFVLLPTGNRAIRIFLLSGSTCSVSRKVLRVSAVYVRRLRSATVTVAGPWQMTQPKICFTMGHFSSTPLRALYGSALPDEEIAGGFRRT